MISALPQRCWVTYRSPVKGCSDWEAHFLGPDAQRNALLAADTPGAVAVQLDHSCWVASCDEPGCSEVLLDPEEECQDHQPSREAILATVRDADGWSVSGRSHVRCPHHHPPVAFLRHGGLGGPLR